MRNPPPPQNDWRVLWPASLLIYLLVLVAMGVVFHQATKGGEQFGWGYAFAYWLMFGWPCALGAVVSLHVLVLAVFQERAYTLWSACWCGPATALLGLLLLGLVQACSDARGFIEAVPHPPDRHGTTSLAPLAVAQSVAWVVLVIMALGLLLSIPHYIFYRRESRRA